MFEADDKGTDTSTLTPDAVSQTKFQCYYENSFGILADQATVIGIKYDESNRHSVLVQERIARHEAHSAFSVIKFGQHDNKINTVLVMQKHQSVFASDYNGNVIQYRLDHAGGTPTIVKNYGDIGIGWVSSSVAGRNLALFGGRYSRLVVIAADMQQMVTKKIPVASGNIKSLSMCKSHVSNKKRRMLLAVCGIGADYSNRRSDLLDFTPCLEALRVSLRNPYKKHPVKKISTETKNQVLKKRKAKKYRHTTGFHFTDKSNDQLQTELYAAHTRIRRLQAELQAANTSRQNLEIECKHLKARLRVLDRDRPDFKRYKDKFRDINRKLQSIKSLRIEPLIQYNGILARLAKVREIFQRYQRMHCVGYNI